MFWDDQASTANKDPLPLVALEDHTPKQQTGASVVSNQIIQDLFSRLVWTGYFPTGENSAETLSK
jgi:hypothetical protein